MTRQINEIAQEIKADWKKVYFEAMESLRSIDDAYGLDTGKSMVVYFLANAGTWRGDTARRVKAELKGML